MKPSSITKYARSQTRISLHHFKTNLREAAKHPDTPAAIHALRVSIRRLNQCFRVFHAPVKQLRRRLHKLMERCGAVRNCDVALELLAECGLTQSPSIPKLKKERADAARKLQRNLKKERRRHHRAADAVPHPSRHWLIAIRLPAMAAEFFRTGDTASSPDASYSALHQFRIHAKHFRYTLELFVGFYSVEMVAAAKSLKGLQDRLGAVNDCVTSMDLLAGDPVAIAALDQLRDQRTQAFQSYWRSHFPPRKLSSWQRWLAEPSIKASTASSGSAKHRG